ncbi:hypothetical protein [Nocardioides sp. 1609]|uniref:hypothetical protein n=1 Tax=Nocardioides sp. 1609 TaxID=2508327 RepID=UPI00106F9BC1|nr:hypothetical protein [Nocardioides sp. 1609]
MTSTVDDTMLDEEWLAAPRRRSRSRSVLAAALVASLCFLGGALTQKNLGADDGAAAAPGGPPAGVPEGLGAGAGGLPGGLPGDQQGTGAQPAETEDGEEDEVIGTVVEKNGDVWVVEDLGGTRHDVTVAGDTSVLREVRLTPARVRAGDQVQITGVARDDGLQATTVTLR